MFTKNSAKTPAKIPSRKNRFIPAALTAAALALALAACMARIAEAPPPPEPTQAQVEPPPEPERLTLTLDRVEMAKVAAPSPAMAMPMLSAVSGGAVYDMAGGYAPSVATAYRMASQPLDREAYGHFIDNPVFLTSEQPVSTFSVDVDTGAYANVRRMLEDGAMPPEDAVRTEELINYFGYDYPAPSDATLPFSLYTEIAPTPWNADTLLFHIGIKGYSVPAVARPAANLVFLIDVSGSMQDADKLALLKPALGLLARQLKASDRVSIVVYAGASGLVLPPTAGDRSGEILAAIDNLSAGGSTNGGDGIRLAYAMARQSYIKGGINRVLLATDGDFNVGTVSFEALLDLVKAQRASGITLTTLGFGTGNFNDHLMEQLADVGNGNYAYIDSMKEARKVLVDEAASTLQVIAGDVKAQVEFNPALVAEYRLIGYENRVLRREDFNNDKVDAGDIGAGHTVTALYEITLVGSAGRQVDDLRYGLPDQVAGSRRDGDELANLKLRFKRPGADDSQLISRVILKSAVRAAGATSDDFRFAAAVAGFGQRLRGGDQLGDFGYPAIKALAQGARGKDPRGERGEFLGLVDLATALSPPPVEAHASR